MLNPCVSEGFSVYLRMKICGIYKITSPSGKIYIGQSKDIKKRWSQYRRLDCKRQFKIYNSLKKYGVKNHCFEVIQECEEVFLSHIERYWQEYYNCVEQGLNLEYNPVNKKYRLLSKESRDKISKSKIGVPRSQETKDKLREINTGKKHLYESRKKMSKSRLGEKNHNYGKRMSEDTKKKISDKNRNMVFTKEHRLKISIKNSGAGNKNSKLVLNLETGIYYDFVGEAALSININRGTLCGWLNGTYKNKSPMVYV